MVSLATWHTPPPARYLRNRTRKAREPVSPQREARSFIACVLSLEPVSHRSGGLQSTLSYQPKRLDRILCWLSLSNLDSRTLLNLSFAACVLFEEEQVYTTSNRAGSSKSSLDNIYLDNLSANYPRPRHPLSPKRLDRPINLLQEIGSGPICFTLA
jgi:hypothetical protein